MTRRVSTSRERARIFDGLQCSLSILFPFMLDSECDTLSSSIYKPDKPDDASSTLEWLYAIPRPSP